MQTDKVFSQAEIDAQNAQGKHLVRMGNKVLDCTGYKHPGGIDKITDRKGKDVLEDFLAMKHSSKAEKIAMEKVIGTYQPNEAEAEAPISSGLLSVSAAAFGPSSSSSGPSGGGISFGPSDPPKTIAFGPSSSDPPKSMSFGPSSEPEMPIQSAQEEIKEQASDGKRYVSYQELAEHADEDDLWMLIDGKVYNTNKFNHPGGKDIMLEHAAADATQAFQDQNHTDAALDELKTLYVGEFRGELPGKAKREAPPGSLKNRLVALGFMLVIFAFFMQYIILAPSPSSDI